MICDTKRLISGTNKISVHYFALSISGSWIMLATIAIILIVLWLLGAFIVPVGGALIHILLVIGIIVLILHFVRGRGPTV